MGIVRRHEYRERERERERETERQRQNERDNMCLGFLMFCFFFKTRYA